MFAGVAIAQQSEIFYWKGYSSNWNDPANWTTSGASGTLPGSEDHVLIQSDALSNNISFTSDVQVASLIVTHPNGASFTSRIKTTISLAGALNLPSSTIVDSGIRFQLSDENSIHHSFSNNLLPQVMWNEGAEGNHLPTGNGGGLRSCAFFTIVPNPVNPTCNGFANGMASVLVPTDGVGPYAYQWVGGPGTRQWNNVGAGTYTILVFDLGQGGASCNLNLFVNEPGPLVVFAMNATAPTCPGDCNGSAFPLVIGGTGGYVYTWPDGTGGLSKSNLCNPFTLNITDQQGCTLDTTYVFVNSPLAFVFNAVVTDIFCAGDNDGSINLTVTGGTGALTISWTGPGGFTAASGNISNLIPGIYTATVLDQNACTDQQSFTVAEVPFMVANASGTNNNCNGQSIGAINLSISQGNPPYSVSWTGPGGFTSGSQNISGLIAGPYQATITDSEGCVLVVNRTVAEPPAIVIAILSTNVACSGGATGSAQASATGGTGGLSYSWTGPMGFTALGANISNLLIGTYEVTVQDGNGCIETQTAVIIEPALLALVFTPSPLICTGGNNGAINLEISGGTGPYSVSWTGPSGFSSTNEDISSLAAGVYNVTVSDFNGCIGNGSEALTNPSLVVISGVATNTTCSTGNTGAIDVTVTGGVEPYIYSWTGPLGFNSTNQDISALAAGNYILTVTDDAFCTVIQIFTVTSPANLNATFSTTNVLCFGGSSGAINTTPSGGTGPYTFLWLGPGGFFSTAQNISGLLAGDYSLMIADANGCMGFFNIILTQGSQINVTRIITNATCFGGFNGAITTTISGGVGPYTFAWTGPSGFTASTQNISGLVAGTYALTVTGSNGCTRNVSYNVNQPVQITINGTVTNLTCFGGNNGAISISITTGVGPFTYSWSGPSGFTASTQNISGLIAGNYIVIATNSAGCARTSMFVMSSPPIITITPTIQNIACFGANNGSIAVIVAGGVGPYSVTWAGPGGYTNTGISISGLSPGNYIATATDASGCIRNNGFNISEPSEIDSNILFSNVSCNGSADGSASVSPSGGTAPYTVSWQGPFGFTSTQQSITSLQPGTYIADITDGAGCVLNESIDITEPLPLDVQISSLQPDCLVNNGSLTALVSGGTVSADYSYAWTDLGGNNLGSAAIISNLGPGEYTLTATDDNGCTGNETLVLTQNALNLVAVLTNNICNGAAQGSIDLTVSGGVAPYALAWTGPGGFSSSSASINGLIAGDYELTVSDNSTCSAIVTYSIAEPSAVTASTLILNETCPGLFDGSIQLTLGGGNPGYTVVWSGPSGFSATSENISNLQPGTYALEVTDAQACVSNFNFDVNPAIPLSLSLSANGTLCNGDATGSATATTNGGVGPYTYDWTGPNSFTASMASINLLFAGNYSVTVTDANGCQISDDVEVTQPDSISAILDLVNSACGSAGGSATVTPSGGTGLISVGWFNSLSQLIGSALSIGSLTSGVYTFELTDANGCAYSELFTISDADGDLAGTPTDITCPGGSDGTIGTVLNGGTAPFIYSWTGPGGFVSAQEQLTDLFAGTYVLTVTDDSGCIYTEAVVVNEPAQIDQTSIVQFVSCNGGDGTIDIVITGGTAPYNVSWAGPGGFTGSGTSIASLEVGAYNYQIEDAFLCTANGSIDVALIPEISIAAIVTDALCGEASTGAVSAVTSGGTAPYIFAWTGPDGFTSVQADIVNLAGGDYTLNITDALGCPFMDMFSVSQPDSLVLTFDLVLPACSANDGSITAIPTGGTSALGYIFEWTDAVGNTIGMDALISNLGTGIYGVSVTDDNGCNLQESVILTNPSGVVVETIGSILCNGDNTGTIGLDVQGAANPFTVDWTGPAGFTGNGTDLANLLAGVYTYTITDALGCINIGTAEVTEPELLLAAGTTAIACYADTNGSVSISTTGGVMPYTFGWTGPNAFTSAIESISDLAPGDYDLIITDNNGCIYSEIYAVDENPEIILDVQSTDLSCFGSADGEADVATGGGTDPLEFAWTGPNGFTSTNQLIDFLEAGVYEVLITDANGCQIAEAVEILSPEEILAGATVQPAGCLSANEGGSIILNPSGGVAAYNAVWSGPNGFTSDSFSIMDIEAGIYNYTITDATGCTVSGSEEIVQAVPFGAEVISSNISCNGLSDGSIQTIFNGGIEPFDIAWSGPNGYSSTDSDISDLATGTYILSVSDANGCQVSLEVEIAQPEILQVDLANSSDPTCNTSADGSIEILVSGGVDPYTYSWSGPDGFTSNETNLNNLFTGAYIVSVIDANLCETALVVDLGFTFEITADAGSDQGVCLNALPLALTGSGLNADTYLWKSQAGDTLSSDALLLIQNLPDGLYSYILEVNNGLCSDTDTVEIEILALPVVTAGEDKIVFTEEAFVLGGNPTSPTASIYSWSPNPGGEFNTAAANPTGFLLESTEFVVVATDANGCTNNDTVFIMVTPDVVITSGITPNDDGVNDTWIIDNIELFPNSVVSVYNRWGEPVFRAAPYQNGQAWGGMHKGNPLPVGTYYYTIDLHDTRFPKPYTGPITIFR